MPFPEAQDAAASWVRDTTRGVADVVAMLRGISSDPRVAQSAKVEASAALAFLVSGRGRVPRFIPVVGRLDDVAVAAFALRRLFASAGEPVIRSHWRGSERALDVFLTMTGALAVPGGRLRRLAVMGAAATFTRDRISPALRERVDRVGRRPGFGKVVDGEVVTRREERR